MACVPPAAAADREGAAVREVARAYERIKVQQPLLLLHQHCSSQLAHSLLTDALRALNLALCVIKQQQQQQQQPQPAAALLPGCPPSVTTPSVVVKAEPPHHVSPPISPTSADSQATARRGNKRRRSSSVMEGKRSSSWVNLTTAPYEDGFQWRKYGEKKINGTSYTRSYFRCTYKDETGCQATKYIQQQRDSNSDQPMFHVTYNNEHTCSGGGGGGGGSAGAVVTSCPPPNAHAASAAAAAMVKQEPPVLLAPLVQVSAARPFDQTPLCQELLIPIGMQQQQQQQFCGAAAPARDDDSHGDAPSTTSSCISGESSDGYSGDTVARMAAVEAASATDDAFYDLELLLQGLLASST